MHVPCVIFDGKSEDFATEMFVIINSTPTRINKSHLVDLYEKVSWAAPDKKFAARVVARLYGEGDSPLRYRINRLGGRSQQQKWILQAELFNELHRWVSADWKALKKQGTPRALVTRLYEVVRDFFKAAEKVWGDAWGDASYMVTRPVTLKAMLRVCADLAHDDAEPEEGRVKRWERKRLSPGRPRSGRSAARASTSGSRPRGRSNASRASTASSAASRRLPRSGARPARARTRPRWERTVIRLRG